MKATTLHPHIQNLLNRRIWVTHDAVFHTNKFFNVTELVYQTKLKKTNISGFKLVYTCYYIFEDPTLKQMVTPKGEVYYAD